MRPTVGHETIRASAGSGKTYQLVNRYIRLLALGVEPARIIALTFTRKAAGEFLQKIFIRLTRAAGDGGAAAQLSREIATEAKGPSFYRDLLSSLVREMGRLQLGTIDSFFARVVGAFPYELGLTRPHRIMDEFERNAARQLAMERLLAPGDEEREQRILQLYKQLTWGAEEKNVYGLFEDKLKDWHDLFLEVRDDAAWGDGARIFTGRPWWLGEEEDPGQLATAAARELDGLDLGKGFLKAFDKLLDAYAAWQPGLPLEGGALWERILEAREDLRTGTAVLKFGRGSTEVGPPLSETLYRMACHFVRGEIARRLVITRSLGGLLAEFDRLYEQSVREAGSLVFADLPMLLIKGIRGGEAMLHTEDIVYRLDGQLDHWLIDEFQDTSRIQWKVLSAFVDEVLQDAGGRRSFFYVGDVKQSIYGWRGGDARLFEEIFDHYNRGGPGIRESVLACSYRSAPPVLACVNGLFGEGLSRDLVGAGAHARWSRQWREHTASGETAGLVGYAAWGEAADAEALAEACIDLINTAKPLERDLSCAVLMRKNDEVATMTQSLREAGVAASMEGVVHIARDNVAGTWLLAFLYSLARPDEAFPRDFLSLPVPEMDEQAYRRLAGRVRAVITRGGYTEAVRCLLEQMAGITQGNPFLRRRSEQILEAATRFRGTSLDSLESFIRYLESATVVEATLHTQVQVMTVHKAKGLDFDMVIVAGFGGETLVRARRQALHVQRDSDGEIRWILDLPPKAVIVQDPDLAQADADHNEDSVFEALCLLYVAMTRARRGLYCLAPEPARGSSHATWTRLFEAAFGGGEDRQQGGITWHREWGDPEWHGKVAAGKRPVPVPVRLDAIRGPMPERRPSLRRMASPSEEAHGGLVVAPQLRSAEGRRFGTRMHDFLATLEWVPFGDTSAKAGMLERADPDLRDRLRAMLEGPLGREVFAQPGQAAEAWRERPYVLRRGEAIATGIIDRAIVLVGPGGRPQSATIYDFKTDALDPARDAQEQLLERYGRQLERYREAVAVLTGLPESAVNAKLVPV
ncbi:MAG: UvrD-helicase domain-containing protein [Oceanipulchritudo sp.]